MSKNEKQGMKKSTKSIIAAAVALVIVAAVLIGIFVIKPAIEKNPDSGKTEITFSDLEQNEGENFEYVSFKGAKMAKELALMLKQAEKDDEKCIENYGYAFEVGDQKISKGEFALFYMDQYSKKNIEVRYSINSKGDNMVGFDVEKTPMEQKYPAADYLWSDKFTADALGEIQNLYATFELALEEGITLDEVEIHDLITSYERAERAVDVGDTADNLIASIYGEGTTYSMFARREIMQKYAVKFEDLKSQEYLDAQTEEKIKAAFDKNPDTYKAIDLRIYPIQGEYDPAEISVINSEEEFLDFAKKNYPQENYNAEIITRIYNTTKMQITSSFGEEVAEWAFAKGRVKGEVAIITGQLYEYLVFIKELPNYDYSHNIIVYNYLFESGETQTEKDKIYEEKEKIFKEFEGKQISAEEFTEKLQNVDYGCNQQDVRAGDIYFEVADWMLDEGRKEGDTAMFASDDDGIFIVYYVKPNTDDLDWKYYIREEIAHDEYMEMYDNFLKDFQITENREIIDDVISDSDSLIKKKIAAQTKK